LNVTNQWVVALPDMAVIAVLVLEFRCLNFHGLDIVNKFDLDGRLDCERRTARGGS
jgi:hypothetical protein